MKLFLYTFRSIRNRTFIGAKMEALLTVTWWLGGPSNRIRHIHLFMCRYLISFSEVMKSNWDARKPVKQNLTEMGLAFDANQVCWPFTTFNTLSLQRCSTPPPSICSSAPCFSLGREHEVDKAGVDQAREGEDAQGRREEGRRKGGRGSVGGGQEVANGGERRGGGCQEVEVQVFLTLFFFSKELSFFVCLEAFIISSYSKHYVLLGQIQQGRGSVDSGNDGQTR